MSDENLITAMRRKAGFGRPEPEVTAMSPAKALRLAVAQAAEASTGMVMHVNEVSESTTSISKLPNEISDHSLLGILEGAHSSYGLAAFNLEVTTSVVEQLTTGSVLKLEPEARRPTSTDSVICFELIDQIIQRFEQIVSEAPDPPDIAGYKIAAQLEETRSIQIAFDDIQYRMYRITVDMAQGTRQGEILLVFPAQRPKPKLEVGGASDWEHQFQASVMTTKANLDAILCRVSLSLGQVAELKAGMMIPLPEKSLSKVEIIADGQKVSTAKLGQLNDYRALRLKDAVDDEGMQNNADFGEGTAYSAQTDMLTKMPAFEGGGDFNMGEGELPLLESIADTLPSVSDITADLANSFAPEVSTDFPAMEDLPAFE